MKTQLQVDQTLSFGQKAAKMPEAKENELLLIECYQIIQAQQMQIEKLEHFNKEKEKQIKALNKNQCNLQQSRSNKLMVSDSKELEQELSLLMKRYEEIVHQNEKLSIMCEDKDKQIAEGKNRQKTLRDQLVEQQNIGQKIKTAYQAKIKKMAKTIREQTIRQMEEKQNRLKQQRERAKSRVHYLANLAATTPSKRTFLQSKDLMTPYTKLSQESGRKRTNLINTPYLDSSKKSQASRKELSTKLFGQGKGKQFYAEDDSQSNPESIQGRPIESKKMKVNEFLEQLQNQLKKFTVNEEEVCDKFI